MRGDRTSEEQELKALKEKLVRKKGWYVPSIHGKETSGAGGPQDSTQAGG